MSEEAPANPSSPPNTAISKQFYRKKVWDHLDRNRLVTFPRPVYGRIPNFKGAEKAAARLLDLEEFKAARAVEVNPDKPLEASRALVVQYDKVLYVPVPQLQEGLLKKISFCNEDKPTNIQQIVTRWGIDILGKSINLDDHFCIDLLVVGSVAVSKDGRRIGKGKGFADLEYAILKEIGAVNEDTVIVTTVHDSQVFDSLPEEIFQKFDVPLDYILTPTQCIKTETELPKPKGIFWDILSERRLKLIPILQKLKDAHAKNGYETTLKAEDSDQELEVPRFNKARRIPARRSKSEASEENGISSTSDDQSRRPRRRRFFTKSRPPITNENEDPVATENGRKRPKQMKRNGRQVDFSLVVSNIDRNVRVRHLKDALIESGIKPNNITWRGYKGFCYLHYGKNPRREEQVEDKPLMDNVIEILQSLKLNPESTANLRVKIMEPTRIETTDVTAV